MKINDRHTSYCQYRYGMSMEEIGTALHISRERVRQIIEKAIKKIRRSPYRHILAEYCTFTKAGQNENDFGGVGRYKLTNR